MKLFCEPLLFGAANGGFSSHLAERERPLSMLLVDEELEKRGSTAVSTRVDVRAAFAHLMSPLVRAARWLDESGGAIVVIHP